MILTSLFGYQHELGRRQRMRRHAAESRRLQLLCELGQRVGVTGRRIGEHGEAEARRHGRRDAIRIRDEFEDGDPAAWLQCAVDLGKKTRAGRRVEMMQEIGDERCVEPGGEFHLERITGQRSMSILDLCSPRVLGGHRKHVRPIDREDFRSRITLSDRDPK